MDTLISTALSILAACLLLVITYVVHLAFIGPRYNPITKLPGPPSTKLIELAHMGLVMEYVCPSSAISFAFSRPTITSYMRGY